MPARLFCEGRKIILLFIFADKSVCNDLTDLLQAAISLSVGHKFQSQPSDQISEAFFRAPVISATHIVLLS